MRIKKSILSIVLIILLLLSTNVYAEDEIKDKVDIDLASKAGILIDTRTGEILYEKEAYTKYYPASTTKVMTALIVLENAKDLKKVTTVSYDAMYSVPVAYRGNLLKVGEELTIEDLLYALLISSSNEAAVVLAEEISGNVESFATMMNTKATELGCINTHFVNPNGVHNKEHYTTAYDLSLIAKEAMKNETFRKIVSTVSYTLPSTNKYDRIDRNLISTNDIIKSTSKYYYEYAIGIKTGYTTPAKNCLVAGASKDGIELIAVVLGAEKYDKKGESIRNKDVINLFDYIYDNFSNKTVIAKDGIANTIKVKGATSTTKNLNLLAENEISALVTNDRVNSTETPEIILKEKIKAPIKKGDVLGVAKYNINGIEYKTNLVAANDVKKSYAFIAMIILIVVIAVFLGLKSERKGKNNKKRNTRKRQRVTNSHYTNK